MRPAPLVPQERSPYSPISRRFRNPIYLRIADIPGAGEIASQLPELARRTAELNGQPLVDWDRVFMLKMEALNSLWAHFGANEQFDCYCAEQGQAVREFASFCALGENFGADWRHWPREYHDPNSTAVAQFISAHENRMRFHQWLQWLLDCQLESASQRCPLMQDMPIGVHPGGADAWVWQDVLASGVGVGAPPDIHNTQGQNWGLPPWIPHRLQAAHYEPFIQTIRAMLRHAGGLRIDHALGLFRLFWIPDNFAACDGAYVRYPHEELMAIIALESQRAGAFIVGEDLGTTEKLVQREMAKHAMLSYRVLWFEKDDPSTYPPLSLAAVTTHDLPTIAGLWSRSDLEDQMAAQTKPSIDAAHAMRQHLRDAAGVSDDMPTNEVIANVYCLIAQAPSKVRLATLEDALAVHQRPNMPGAAGDWPNWSRRLPQSIESFANLDLPRRIADSFNKT